MSTISIVVLLSTWAHSWEAEIDEMQRRGYGGAPQAEFGRLLVFGLGMVNRE